jgi:putative ABC transport system permease protein
MSMLTLLLTDVWAKKSRSLGLAFAVAIAVMCVVTLTVVGSGLENSAAAVLSVGKADFTVAQKGAPDILGSNLDTEELARVRATKGVSSAVGVLVETEKLNASNPVFIEIGIPPSELTEFGVTVVAGRPYQPDATNEVMLGWRTAQNFGLHVGDLFHAQGTENRVVGIYSTGNSFGDSAAMFSLPSVQAYNRLPGTVTLVFVKVASGYRVSNVENRITYALPELTTIRTATEFGRADRNLVFLKAAATGSTILAIAIGAILVGNTMMLSLFERTREFGLLRAVGWTRARVVSLLLGQGFVLAIVGAAAGVALSFAVTAILEGLPQLAGVLHSQYTSGAFLRGLATGVGMTVMGTLYPALRAGFLTPLEALSHE